jgi:hypothetical protein
MFQDGNGFDIASIAAISFAIKTYCLLAVL